MPEEITSVEMQEVAEPVTEELASEETTEVAEPSTTSEETSEVAEPKKSERDAWFAEQRRKLEAEKKESESRFNAQLEAERAKIAELESFRKQFEEQQREAKLRQMAEETGVPYDELVEEVKRQEAAEELAKTLETERQSKTELEQKIQQLQADMRIRELEQEDKEYFRSLNIKPELDETFYKLRANGFTSEEAYLAIQAKRKTVEVAPAPGKVNTTQVDPEFISEAEYNAMSQDQRDRLLKTDLDKLWRSQQKWLRK